MDCAGRTFYSGMKGHGSNYNVFSLNLKEPNEGLKVIKAPMFGLRRMSEKNREAGCQVAEKIVDHLTTLFLGKILIYQKDIFNNILQGADLYIKRMFILLQGAFVIPPLSRSLDNLSSALT
jgi:hypothetical protein